MIDLTKDIPFDQFSRQHIVSSVINNLRSPGVIFTILDVGGYKGNTNKFLPNDKLTVLDVFDVQETGYIKGNALAMEFENGSFDFVASFDVLEHISAAERNTFLAECMRVARRGVLIAAPQYTEENALSEVSLNHLYKTMHGKNHEWLEEHINYGLPEFDKLEIRAKKAGGHTFSLCSNDTEMWYLMQGAIFVNSKYPQSAGELIELNRYYNVHFTFDGGDITKQSYRRIFCVFKDSKDQQQVASTFAKKTLKITLKQRLIIMSKLQEQNMALLTRLAERGNDFEKLHELEKQRVDHLQSLNNALTERRSREPHVRIYRTLKKVISGMHIRKNHDKKKH